MKTFILIAAMLLAVGTFAEEKGYLVAVDCTSGKIKRTITQDSTRVEQIFESYFGTDLDIVKILENSPYFDLKTDDVYFYTEVGTVKKKKNGELKFRKKKKSRK